MSDSKLSKREVIRLVLEGGRPPYVPWSLGLTKEAREKLAGHYGTTDLEGPLGNHLLKLGSNIGFFEPIGRDRVRDVFGAVWDRSIDKDIGNVDGCVLPEPTLSGYTFPDPCDGRFFADIPEKLECFPDRFRVFQIGFSLYERAWTLRGMENLMIDMLDRPAFVHEVLRAIADYNIAQIGRALQYDIDAVYFGDDWGQQQGLQMGGRLWRTFLRPPAVRAHPRLLHGDGLHPGRPTARLLRTRRRQGRLRQEGRVARPSPIFLARQLLRSMVNRCGKGEFLPSERSAASKHVSWHQVGAGEPEENMRQPAERGVVPPGQWKPRNL